MRNENWQKAGGCQKQQWSETFRDSLQQNKEGKKSEKLTGAGAVDAGNMPPGHDLIVVCN
jgi:hypothetical protein